MKTTLTDFAKREWLQLLLITLPLLAALIALPYASDRVPMQWNLQGQVNWYAPKAWGLFVTPVSVALVYVLLIWMESRDPARHRESDGRLTAHGKATRAIRLGVSFVLGAVAVVQIASALGYKPDMGRWVVTGVALLMAFMGNLFGKLKPNRYAGIRVPWTLNSEHVWRQTHRVAGWIWTTSGILVAAMSWLLPKNWLGSTFHIVWMVILIVPPLVVAWHEARAEARLHQGAGTGPL